MSQTQQQQNNYESLLSCLEHLTSHYGRPQSRDSMLAGLAYDGQNFSIELFKQAAIKAKIRTKIEKRTLQSLNEDLCPTILILNDNQSCVLYELKDGKAKIYRTNDRKKVTINLETLDKDYAGYAILVHPFTERRRHQRHWFWSVIRDSKQTYRKVLMAALLINIFGLAGPLFIMNVYDRVIPNNAFETGWVLAIGAFTIFAFDFLMRTLRGYFIDFSGRKIDVIIGRRIYDQLMNMKMIFKPKSSGAFANMLREFETVKEFCTSATLATVVDLPFSLLFIFVIYLLAGNIAFVLLAIMAIVIIAGFIIQIPLKALVGDTMQSAEAKHGLLVETINGLETVKLTQADARMRAKYSECLGESAEMSQQSRFYSALAVNISSFFQQSASIIIVLFGMYMIQDGTLTMGALIAAVIMGGKAIAPMGQMAALITRFHSVRRSLDTLNAFMQQDVERSDDKNFLHRPDLKGIIDFKSCGFIYPNDTRKILNGVNLSVKAGEKIGIVGRIGSGKSTLTKIVAGLYEPSEGEILIDGTDYRQIDPADLRRVIGYISQDTFLFRGSIRDNIAYGKQNATEQDILAASKLSGVHDFVSKHPMGYDAPVGERGDGLSGGQKQCVALARALISDPKILICDEPTNDMDTQAEENFAKQIFKLSENKTMILITHRQNLLRLVDRLIVVEGGQIVADGPREKIIKALSGGNEVKDE